MNAERIRALMHLAEAVHLVDRARRRIAKFVKPNPVICPLNVNTDIRVRRVAPNTSIRIRPRVSL